MENWPKLNLDPLRDNGMCFGCGKTNPIGLKLKFAWDGKTARTEFTPGANLQGWSGYLHGGITACILDEAMGWVALFAGTNNVTAKMEIRYRKMVPIGNTYVVSSTVTKKTSRLVETIATLSGQDGDVFAEGTSSQFVVSSRKEDHR